MNKTLISHDCPITILSKNLQSDCILNRENQDPVNFNIDASIIQNENGNKQIMIAHARSKAALKKFYLMQEKNR